MHNVGFTLFFSDFTRKEGIIWNWGFLAAKSGASTIFARVVGQVFECLPN